MYCAVREMLVGGMYYRSGFLVHSSWFKQEDSSQNPQEVDRSGLECYTDGNKAVRGDISVRNVQSH